MSRDETWVNSDGLSVGFGTHSADNEVQAVIATEGAYKVMKFKVLLSSLISSSDAATAATAAAAIPPQAVSIPRGSYITKVTVQGVGTVSTGVLDVGTYAWRDTNTTPVANGTLDDIDGLINGATAAILTGGLVVEGDVGTYGGALVNGTTAAGAVSDSNVTVLATYDTTAFTAGSAIITVEYLDSGVLVA